MVVTGSTDCGHEGEDGYENVHVGSQEADETESHHGAALVYIEEAHPLVEHCVKVPLMNPSIASNGVKLGH